MSNFVFKVNIRKRKNNDKTDITVSLTQKNDTVKNIKSIKIPKKITNPIKILDKGISKPIKVLKRIIVHNDRVQGGTYGRRQWVNLDEAIMTEHYSKQSGTLTSLDPQYHGTGIKGAESKRKKTYPEYYVDRIYHYMKGTDPERNLSQKPKYFGKFAKDDIYDFDKDPLNLQRFYLKQANGNKDLALTLAEKNVFERGFKGMLCHTTPNHPVLISFVQHDVKRARNFVVNLTAAKTSSDKKRMKKIVEKTKKAENDGNQSEIHKITKEAIDLAFNSPYISIDEAIPTMGLQNGGGEASFELHLSGDPEIILGRTALFLKTLDQDAGIVREFTNDIDEMEALGEKVSQAMEIKIGENDYKEIFDIVKKQGFGGATYNEDKNMLYICHIPQYEIDENNKPTIRYSNEGFESETVKLVQELAKNGFTQSSYAQSKGQLFLHQKDEKVDNDIGYDYFIKAGIAKERKFLSEDLKKQKEINRIPHNV